MSKTRRRERFPSAGIIHEGSLTGLGYHLDKHETARHRALNNAERRYGYKETIDKLVALEVVNKAHPSRHARIREDITYLQERHHR